MSSCGTCRHWGTDADSAGWGYIGHVERRPGESEADAEARAKAIEDRYRTCAAMPEFPSLDEQDREDIRAYAVDASEYRASLRTRADFGCVLHQPPSAPEPSS